MKKLFRRFILSAFSLSLFAFCFAFCMPSAHAETHITADTQFSQTTTWTKDGSPYILDDDIYIPRGEFLSIGPGVTVTTSSSSPGSLDIGGTLAIYGSVDDPVTITNLTDFSLLFSTSTISNAVIDVPTGLNITAGYVEISSSTITDADHGIDARGATLQISNSVISGNRYGIYSHPMPPPIFQAFNNSLRYFFGIHVANAQVSDSDNPKENHITISSSSVINNSLYGVYNSTGNVVNAQNNWWGSSTGPVNASSTQSTSSAVIFGNVNYTPWLVQDPRAAPIATPCCSNVLFLPGIEGSRLYLDQKGIFGTSTNELWEPNRNADVQKLFMTPTGQSINSGIYTKDVIDSALGLPWSPIYKGFIAMMNGVVADKTINSWQAYPYDWRFGVDSIVSSALVNTVQSLASTSKTGKVTIVAHSDGGLVAKLLAKTLADKGESGLLDKVILVAVPQLGTPQAIPGLLHGDNESLAGGVILTQSIARQLAENMPGAYGLLPSRGYFSNATSSLFGSIVSFASSTLAISSYDALRSFLAGISDHRAEPSASDTQSPTLLHTAMIDASQKIHDIIDSFSFASTTQAIILAGWGNSTLSAISYFEKKVCSDSAMTVFLGTAPKCTNQLEHSASTTIFGDGIVILQSAVAAIASSSDYYFDLGSENKGKMISDSHSDILSTDSGVAFVKQEITASSSPVSTSSAQPTLPPYISSSAPTMADAHEDDLIVSVHSPVELNIYDSQGRHTGPIPNPIPNSDLGMYETGIPDSQYVPNDGDTYVRVPYGTDYRVTFTGTGMGSFEVDTQHNVNDVIVANTTFADMPVTPLLKAELVLATTTQSSATSTSSTTQMMLFDFNGDGTIDATSTPHDAYDPILDMESYQSIVSTLGLSPYKEKILHDKLAYIIDCLRKKKPLKEVKNPDRQAIAAATQAVTDIKNQHWVFKNLDSAHKQQLENIFEAFIDDVDTSQ